MRPLLTLAAIAATASASGPFLTTIPSSSNSTSWIIGNDLWNITIGEVYGTKLYFGGRDLIGNAVGYYAGYDGENNFEWTSASVYQETEEYLDIVFSALQIDFHWVIYPELAGAYQYIVNKELPTLSVLRSLFRLDNGTFTRGRTNIKNGLLPLFSEILSGTKVQDETWELSNGSFITKYDWSARVREIDFHGLYGDDFGSFYIRPGKDYFNGNQLAQELTVHRESSTGDSVQLNVVHDSHFRVSSKATFPVGKIWGPWLWYLNDGSLDDAANRTVQESASWPYSFLNDTAYQSRGEVSGRLVLSDGRPASQASVFLGDSNSNTSTLDQGTDYYYTTSADSDGYFNFTNVRLATYGLYAWGNGDILSNVTTTFTLNDVSVVDQSSTLALGSLLWTVPSRQQIFQIGALDRKAQGFRNAGGPYQHGLVADSPANLTYTIGQSNESDWYFGQSALGAWTVLFNVPESDALSNKSAAILSISFASYSQPADLIISINGQSLANLTTDTLKNDPALYRSATDFGEWRFFEYEIDADVLNEGSNELVFSITKSTLWKGFMYDAIILEWA